MSATGFVYEIAGRLVSAGGLAYGTDLFVGRKAILPGADDPRYAAGFVVVVETGGTAPMRTQRGASVARPTAQLSAMAKNAPEARSKIQAAYAALGGDDGLANVSLAPVGGGAATFYQRITPRQAITDIGPDSNAGAMLTFNIEAMKQPS